jgi:hypothetical protein
MANVEELPPHAFLRLLGEMGLPTRVKADDEDRPFKG